MFCKACGTEIPTGASECPKCGKPVETIMVAEEKKTESVAASAPAKTAESAPAANKKSKSDNLIPPAILLIISVGGLVYMYIDNTFGGIISWFTSTAEETKHLPGNLNRAPQMDELSFIVAAIVVAILLAIIAVIGLVMLFQRLGRKFSRKD